MDLKEKINKQKEYYKTTVFYDALVIIKNALKSHQFVLIIAIAIIVSFGILISPFTYKTLHWNEANNSGNSNTDNHNNSTDTEFNEYIYVTVSGEVKNAGMFKMTTDDRVNDAIEKAGGFTENAYIENLNLAQKLTDEQFIHVMSKKEHSALTSIKEETPTFTGVININTATVEELCKLPGIGEVTAKKIIRYRELTCPYEDIMDIQNVDGIGPAKFEKIKNNITT